ncbi:MAG: serine/threonine-protein kinase [Acidobacteriota bacterium]
MTSPPKKYGRFSVEEELGRGGMGVVYRAVDPVIGRSVAIKVLHTDSSLSAKARGEVQSRFEQEFRSAGNLIHPSLVTIYDVGQEGNESFIAMECVEGDSLERMLRSGRDLSFKEVSDLLERLCSGLDYAHDAGIVHRDVKPANVLLTESGRPKITDFGVAKVRSANLTLTGTVIGTPAYMAPEQILGEPVTGAADQFSVGVILYQMLTGELPFIGDMPTTTLYKIVHEEPAPPSSLNETLPPEIDEAVLKSLAKSPADRYACCTDLANAVRDALGATPQISPESTSRTVTLAGAEPFDAEISHAGSGSYGGAVTWANRKPTPRYGLLAFGAIALAMIGWFGAQMYFERVAAEEPTEEVVAEGETTAQETATSQGDLPAPVEETPSEPPTPVLRSYTVVSEPAGATVLVDGERGSSVTPLTLDLDPEASIEIAVELDGYKPQSLQASLADYPDGELRFQLERKIVYGFATLQAPYEVLLSSGGARSKKERAPKLRLTPGRHPIDIEAPEVFFRRSVTVEIEPGQTAQLPSLPETLAVRFASIPGNSRVFIDGQFVDEAPMTQRLTLGSTHELRFEWPDGTSKTERHRIDRSKERIVVAKQ